MHWLVKYIVGGELDSPPDTPTTFDIDPEICSYNDEENDEFGICDECWGTGYINSHKCFYCDGEGSIYL